MELLGDLFLLFCVTIGVWEFILRPLRVADGLGPLVAAVADGIRAILPPIGRFAHWLIVGAPRHVSSVSSVQQVPSTPTESINNVTEDDEPAERTNEPERLVLFLAVERLQVDRSRSALIALLVEAGWQTVDIRNTLKGTSSDLSDEIRAARSALASDADMLLVRDGKSERLIVK